MPIDTTGSVATEVPAGTQTEFRITESTFDPDNRFGPQLELELELTDEKYLGTTMRYWAAIQQPRLDKVRRLRGDGLDDEDIASVLKKQSYKFKKVDEPDKMVVGRAGNLYKILTAVEGSAKGAEAALKRCNGFEELAEVLLDGTFVGTTKRSQDGKYCQLDGQEEIYPVVTEVRKAQAEADTDAELDDIEFNDEMSPPPAF